MVGLTFINDDNFLASSEFANELYLFQLEKKLFSISISYIRTINIDCTTPYIFSYYNLFGYFNPS